MRTPIKQLNIKCSLTRHKCAHCGKIVYIRASFFDCPFCKKETQSPVYLEFCVCVVDAILELVKTYVARFGTRLEITAAISKHLPEYTPEQIDIIYQDFC